MEVLVVERLLDEEVGECLRTQRSQSVAEIAPRRRPCRVGRPTRPCSNKASPTATQCLQKAPSRPTGHVQEPASAMPASSSRTR